MTGRRLLLAAAINVLLISLAVWVKGDLGIFLLCLSGGALFATVVSPFLPKSEFSEDDMERWRNVPVIGKVLTFGWWWMGAGRKANHRSNKE